VVLTISRPVEAAAATLATWDFENIDPFATPGLDLSAPASFQASEFTSAHFSWSDPDGVYFSFSDHGVTEFISAGNNAFNTRGTGPAPIGTFLFAEIVSSVGWRLTSLALDQQTNENPDPLATQDNYPYRLDIIAVQGGFETFLGTVIVQGPTLSVARVELSGLNYEFLPGVAQIRIRPEVLLNAGSFLAVDDIVIEGSAIPEPGSLGLIALAMWALRSQSQCHTGSGFRHR